MSIACQILFMLVFSICVLFIFLFKGEQQRRIITEAAEAVDDAEVMWLCNAQDDPDQATVLKYAVFTKEVSEPHIGSNSDENMSMPQAVGSSPNGFSTGSESTNIPNDYIPINNSSAIRIKMRLSLCVALSLLSAFSF